MSFEQNMLDTFGENPGVFRRDLKINFSNLLLEGSLDAEEKGLLLEALARSLDSERIADFARAWNAERNPQFTPEILNEAREGAALMGMLNSYYKFRTYLKEGDAEIETSYGAARLRMLSLNQNQLGKVRFEILALAVSIVNGCPTCIQAHERELRTKHGVSVEKLHDIARLSSVAKAVAQLP